MGGIKTDISWLFGQGIGWLGVAFGLLVAPPQLYKIIRYKRTKNISRLTYGFLILTMMCYFAHAVYICDWPFMVSNGLNLAVNGAIFGYLIYDGKKIKEGKKRMSG